MSNSAQTLNPNQTKQGQKDQYSSQSNPAMNNENAARKVGNNVEKDEPTAQKRTGGMKDEADFGAESSQGRTSSDAE